MNEQTVAYFVLMLVLAGMGQIVGARWRFSESGPPPLTVRRVILVRRVWS